LLRRCSPAGLCSAPPSLPLSERIGFAPSPRTTVLCSAIRPNLASPGDWGVLASHSTLVLCSAGVSALASLIERIGFAASPRTAGLGSALVLASHSTTFLCFAGGQGGSLLCTPSGMRSTDMVGFAYLKENRTNLALHPWRGGPALLVLPLYERIDRTLLHQCGHGPLSPEVRIHEGDYVPQRCTPLASLPKIHLHSRWIFT